MVIAGGYQWDSVEGLGITATEERNSFQKVKHSLFVVSAIQFVIHQVGSGFE
jgi:hypothetical protein